MIRFIMDSDIDYFYTSNNINSYMGIKLTIQVHLRGTGSKREIAKILIGEQSRTFQKHGRRMFASNPGLDPLSVPLYGTHAHPNRGRYAISGRRNSGSLVDASRWDAAPPD